MVGEGTAQEEAATKELESGGRRDTLSTRQGRSWGFRTASSEACCGALRWLLVLRPLLGKTLQVWGAGGRPAFYCTCICFLLEPFLCKPKASFWIEQIQSLRGKQGSMAEVQKARHELP